MTIQPLLPSQLYQRCHLDELPFTSTDELSDIEVIVGQDRAMEAIKFGIRLDIMY